MLNILDKINKHSPASGLFILEPLILKQNYGDEIVVLI